MTIVPSNHLQTVEAHAMHMEPMHLAESGTRECIPGVISRSRIPGNETAAFPEETGTADILAAESSNRSDSEIRMYSKHLTVTRIIAWCVCGAAATMEQ